MDKPKPVNVTAVLPIPALLLPVLEIRISITPPADSEC